MDKADNLAKRWLCLMLSKAFIHLGWNSTDTFGAVYYYHWTSSLDENDAKRKTKTDFFMFSCCFFSFSSLVLHALMLFCAWFCRAIFSAWSPCCSATYIAYIFQHTARCRVVMRLIIQRNKRILKKKVLVCAFNTGIEVTCLKFVYTTAWNKKASIRWQDSARRQFQEGLRGDVGL